ncbi:hypothetical protein, partial [Fulvivirga sp.]
ENFLKLFVDTHGQISVLYSKDSVFGGGWNKLTETQKSKYADRFMKVAIDNKRIENLAWLDYKHPISYAVGFINYIDVSKLKSGMHTLTVDLDTANFNTLQKKTILDRDPPIIRYAKINFYKAE